MDNGRTAMIAQGLTGGTMNNLAAYSKPIDRVHGDEHARDIPNDKREDAISSLVDDLCEGAVITYCGERFTWESLLEDALHDILPANDIRRAMFGGQDMAATVMWVSGVAARAKLRVWFATHHVGQEIVKNRILDMQEEDGQ